MTEPHGIDAERLGALVDGAPPADGAEGALVALLSEVRGLEQGAPDGLRARVRDELARAGADGETRGARRRRALDPRWWRRGAGEGRRGLLVAAPVAAAIVAAALFVVPALDDGGGGAGTVAPAAPASREAEPAPVEGAPGAAVPADSAAPAATPPLGDPARLTAVDAAVRVRVPDREALARSVALATRTVRDLGGEPVEPVGAGAGPGGGGGPVALAFRVPPGSVEAALEGLSRLGTVTGQRIDAVDVTASVRRAERRLAGLRRRDATLRARSAAAPGDAELAARAVRAGAATRRAEASLAALRARAGQATLTLTLTGG